MEAADRKMFAPIFRGPARSPETEVCAALGTFGVGATAAVLAEGLVRSGVAIGSRDSVARRVAELLEDLERAARVERIPDGRYRLVKARR